MNFDEYQEKARTTAKYQDTVIYPVLGLNGEAGEVAEKIKKVLRDDNGVFSDEKKIEIAKEIGDVLWYCSALATDLGFSLNTIAVMNIDKLFKRKDDGKISGSGDNR